MIQLDVQQKIINKPSETSNLHFQAPVFVIPPLIIACFGINVKAICTHSLFSSHLALQHPHIICCFPYEEEHDTE